MKLLLPVILGVDAALPTVMLIACRQRYLGAAHIACWYQSWELFVLPASGSFLPKSVKLAELHVIWQQGMRMAERLRRQGCSGAVCVQTSSTYG